MEKSFPIRTGDKDDVDGSHKAQRAKFVNIHDNYPDTKQFYNLKTKRWNVWRLKKSWDDALIFEVDDEFTPCRIGREEEFGIFYQDDCNREMRKTKKPPAVSGGFGWFIPCKISKTLEIVDDSNMSHLKTLCNELEMMEDGFRLDEKDIIFVTKSGNIVFIKLS